MMRSLFSIGVIGCFLAGSMATMIRLPVDNAIINSYTTFLDKYNPQEAHNINSIKQFIQTDENIAPGGLMAQNEELLTRAQINYAVVKKTPPADSIRQFGILYEWLDTRATESTGRAKALITTMGELKHVMTNNTPESALVALVNLYMKMEQLYTGSAMRIWSIEQFVKFAGLPRNKSYLNTLIATCQGMLNSNITAEQMHWLDAYALGAATVMRNHRAARISNQVTKAVEKELIGNALKAEMKGWIASWQGIQQSEF